jgi:hypothetical protein
MILSVIKILVFTVAVFMSFAYTRAVLNYIGAKMTDNYRAAERFMEILDSDQNVACWAWVIFYGLHVVF